ncbi:MAG TPA: branched-chain amino acid ABC transporter ATP-binding protein [Oxalobacteraceae bacterium]|nr:branched-chain amino acid ABC transporter ATP-binding protein [Oxalobacteraceae bacterium]
MTLAIDMLNAGYGGKDVLHDVSLKVDAGETVTLLGANTAGKSSLLRSISGLVPQVRGKINFNGANLIGRPAHTIPELGIAHVPEGRHVFPLMTVYDNLLMGAYTLRRKDGLDARIEAVFALFPRLRERRNQAAGLMSGGEQQMVAIGRALMLEPKLLLLDEPSHGLAPIVVDELHEALLRINATGVSVLLVEQNAQLALSIASRGYVLESGRLVLQGSAAELRANDEVRRAYLGL